MFSNGKNNEIQMLVLLDNKRDGSVVENSIDICKDAIQGSAGDPCLKMESLHFEEHGSSRTPLSLPRLLKLDYYWSREPTLRTLATSPPPSP